MYAFGDTYGGVAADRRGLDEMNLRVLESNRAAQERADAQAQQQYQFQAERDARDASIARNEARQAANDATSLYQFNTEQNRLNRGETAREKQNADELAYKRDLFKFQTSELSSPHYNEALKAIDSGIIETPDQIDVLFPKITPQEKNVLLAHFGVINKQIGQDFSRGEQSAKTLNQYLNASSAARVAGEKSKLGARPWFWNTGDYDAKVAAIPTAASEADVLGVETNPKLRRLLPDVGYDMTAAGYTNALPRPYNFTPPNTMAQVVLPPISPLTQPAPFQFAPPVSRGIMPPGNLNVASSVAQGPQPMGGVPVINSQAEYDNLPAGTLYQDSNGRKARKK